MTYHDHSMPIDDRRTALTDAIHDVLTELADGNAHDPANTRAVADALNILAANDPDDHPSPHYDPQTDPLGAWLTTCTGVLCSIHHRPGKPRTLAVTTYGQPPLAEIDVGLPAAVNAAVLAQQDR